MDPALRPSAAPKPSTWVGQHDPPYERRRAATEGPSRRRYLPSVAWRASTLARRVTISPAEKSVAFALARGSGTRRHCPDLRTTDSPTSPVRRTPDSRARPIANWDPVGCKRRREKRESVAAPQRRTQTRASAWKQQRCLLPRRATHGHPSALRGGTGAPLARQRGGRPRWRDTPAESTGAPTRRRSCGREGSRRSADRDARRCARPGKDVARAGGGGHVLRRSLRSLRSVIRRQDPPATSCGPATPRVSRPSPYSRPRSSPSPAAARASRWFS